MPIQAKSSHQLLIILQTKLMVKTHQKKIIPKNIVKPITSKLIKNQNIRKKYHKDF